MQGGLQLSREVNDDDATSTYTTFEDEFKIPGGCCLVTQAVPRSILMKCFLNNKLGLKEK